MKVYVAGPMRGYALYNFPEFDRVSAYLRSLGHEVRSPAENDRVLGFDHRGSYSEGLLQKMFRWDIESVLWADVIALLEGWEQSEGVKIEATVARAIGTPMLTWSHPAFDHPPVVGGTLFG